MLDGKRVLITGANGGIGSSISEILLKNNAKLILLYHKNRNNIDKLIENFPDHKLEVFQLDLLDDTKLNNTMESILSSGHIDCLIHGVTFPISYKSILEKKWEHFQKNIELQTKSLFQLIDILVPVMKNQKHGKIINILSSSVIGTPPSGASDYVVGKYSLLGISKALAVELGKFNITVNCISPSMTNTSLIENLPSKLKEISISQTPLGRLGEPRDIASLTLFLCSDMSDFISGENFLVTGGQIMH
jgi:3-oxoacyl-[acyl-carrier protein] reductase